MIRPLLFLSLSSQLMITLAAPPIRDVATDNTPLVAGLNSTAGGASALLAIPPRQALLHLGTQKH